ncbi:MAG: hypothetical protein RIT43_914 [Bacteroidota bacterium]
MKKAIQISSMNLVSNHNATHSRGWSITKRVQILMKCLVVTCSFILFSSESLFAQENLELLNYSEVSSEDGKKKEIIETSVLRGVLRVNYSTESIPISPAPVELAKTIRNLHSELSANASKLDPMKRDHLYNASLFDFERLCPNYPLKHFAEMDANGIEAWVVQYPDQAKALKEILEYVNSELKK